MNFSYNTDRYLEIDIADFLWKLLMQWKAVLIICMIATLLFPSIKYAKDRIEYKADIAEKAEAEEQSSKSVDEQIEAALSLLPDDQREDVLFVAQQKDMIEEQKKYVNNSIWLNSDPTSQRQLAVEFVLSSKSGTDMRTLADAYSNRFHRNDALKNLREIISQKTSLEYIDELIDTRNTNILAGDAESAIYTITVVLLDDTDADKVLELIDSEANSFHDEINSKVGEHSILRADIEDRVVFNQDTINRRRDLLTTINNLNSGLDVIKNKLSPEQQTAYEAIVAAKHSDNSDEEDLAEDGDLSSDPQPPAFRWKFGLLGFVLGGILYAGIYFAFLTISKVLASSSIAQSYTNTRILGEIYKLTDHTGILKLFTSDKVARLRYKEKLNEDKQIESLVATLESVCFHHNTDRLTLFLSGISNEFDNQIEHLISKCKNAGNIKSLDLVNADEMDEKMLNSVKNAIYVLSNKTKVDKLDKLICLAHEYDVKPLGMVYMEAL